MVAADLAAGTGRVTLGPAGRSLADFEPLLPAEERLRDAVVRGNALDLSAPGDSSPSPPPAGDTRCRVRGRFLRFLALGGDTEVIVHENGIYLTGAWIDGTLDFNNAAVKAFLALRACTVDHVIVNDAVMPYFSLSGCHLPLGLQAQRLQCANGLFLDNLRADLPINFEYAQLGPVYLADSTLGMAGAAPPDAEVCTLESANLAAKLAAARHWPRDGKPLAPTAAERSEARNILFVDDGRRIGALTGYNLAATDLNVSGVTVAGWIDLRYARLAKLFGNGLQVAGGKLSLDLSAATVTGEVQLLTRPAGNGQAERRCTLAGSFQVYSATLGNVFCDAIDVGAADPGARAINFSGTTSTGNVYLRGATTSGPIDLQLARLNDLIADGLTVKGNAAIALDLTEARVVGKVALIKHGDTPTTLSGSLVAARATLGKLECPGLDVGPTPPTEKAAIDLGDATITRSLCLYDAARIGGRVNLAGATVGVLKVEGGIPEYADERPARWAGNARFDLNGLTYTRVDIVGDAPRYDALAKNWLCDRLPGAAGPPAPSFDARLDAIIRAIVQRLMGLPLSPTTFRPQPWDALIAGLRAAGEPLDATRLAIAKQDEYRRAGKARGAFRWTLHWLHGKSVRYGYKPELLLIWLAGLWLIGTATFTALGPSPAWPGGDLLVPAKKGIAVNCLVDRVIGRIGPPCPTVPAKPEFVPWWYSADLLVPGFHLGEADEWDRNWNVSGVRRGLVLWLAVVTWAERILGAAGFSVLAVLATGYLLKKRD